MVGNERRNSGSMVLHPLVGIYALVLSLVSLYALTETDNKAMVLGLCVAGTAAVAVIVNPFYGGLLFVLALFTRPGERYEVLAQFRVQFLLGALTVGAWASQYMIERRPGFVRHNVNWAMFWFMLTIVWSVAQYGFEEMKTVASIMPKQTVIIWFILANLVRTTQRLRITAWTLWATALYLANSGLRGDNEMSGERIASLGWTSDPNDLAAVLVTFLPFGLALIWSERGFYRRLVLMAGTAFILYAINDTKSRGGWLALAVVLTLEILDRVKDRRMRAVILGLSLLVSPVALDAAFRSRGDQSGGLAGSSSSANAMSRRAAWRAGWNMMVDRPLTGVGVYHFQDEFIRYKPDWTDVEGSMTAHSTYFLCMGELGLPGIICFTILVLRSLLLCQAVRRRLEHTEVPRSYYYISRALRTSMFGWMVAGGFLSHTYMPWLYMIMGLVLGSYVIMDEELDPSPVPEYMRRRPMVDVALPGR